tara:strand:- start:439 stop:717 length:279 start_codon:yes stop_codon:yes gene_type:complete
MSDNTENTNAVAEETPAPKMTEITFQDFYDKLSSKVSGYNAKLLLNTACINSGIQKKEETLNEEEVKQICLELIKKGGPSFQVGKEVYGQIH